MAGLSQRGHFFHVSICERVKLNCSAVSSPTHTIVAHLEALDDEFGKYFSEAELWCKDKTWLQFPFKDSAADGSNLTVTEEDQLIELSTDSTYRNTYDTRPLIQFWIFCQSLP